MERFNFVVLENLAIEDLLYWALDVALNENWSRNRKYHCVGNLALLRKPVLDWAWLGRSKGSMRGRLKRAGWNGCLAIVLFQFTEVRMRWPGWSRACYNFQGFTPPG